MSAAGERIKIILIFLLHCHWIGLDLLVDNNDNATFHKAHKADSLLPLCPCPHWWTALFLCCLFITVQGDNKGNPAVPFLHKATTLLFNAVSKKALLDRVHGEQANLVSFAVIGPWKNHQQNEKPQGDLFFASSSQMPMPPGQQGQFCGMLLCKGVACHLNPCQIRQTQSMTCIPMTERFGSPTFILFHHSLSTWTWSTPTLLQQQGQQFKPSLLSNLLNRLRITAD